MLYVRVRTRWLAAGRAHTDVTWPDMATCVAILRQEEEYWTDYKWAAGALLKLHPPHRETKALNSQEQHSAQQFNKTCLFYIFFG